MLQCPVCKDKLMNKGTQWICGQGHSYDLSRKNTLNLLMSQKRKSKIQGDDKKMVDARSRFLDQGYYRVLCEGIIEQIPPHVTNIVDLGCGEGWYTQQIHRAFPVETIGIDISKTAVDKASQRNKSITWVIGSSYAISLLDDSVDVCYSVFAPFDPKEVQRILKEGGTFIQVVPDADHLYELKELVYDAVRLNDPVPYLQELKLETERKIDAMIEIEGNQALLDLFSMTPYTYTTPQKFVSRLHGVDKLCVRIACYVRKYTKN
ncbi:hypothetical protein AOC36_01040 [Erysipelothrix larvae]|uniref:Uncharacterized protein n=1 Tax=Erysipelothrix larvae TaxID=1514105 RepID=A0A109UGF2_9FIRM|nr:methyltransferase domain-containing protein [Erysipelothrix larvae]AMC92627.1 hypothetical protein AOC36_01040 [Erysipelothrix larvae]